MSIFIRRREYEFCLAGEVYMLINFVYFALSPKLFYRFLLRYFIFLKSPVERAYNRYGTLQFRFNLSSTVFNRELHEILPRMFSLML